MRDALAVAMRRWLAAAVLLGGCGACSPTQWAGEPDVFGAHLVATPSAGDYTKAPDFRPRVRAALKQTAAYFGRKPLDFAGLRIVVTDVVDPARRDISGYFDPGDNTITVTYLPGTTPCVEDLTLPHEALHYFLGGDPEHTDPKWNTVLDLMKEIGFGGC